MPVTKSISLGAAYTEFVMVFLPSRNYAGETQRAYSSDIAELVEYLAGQGTEYVEEVHFGHLSGFINGHKRRGLKASSKARKIFSTKVFFGYLEDYGYIGRNPSNQLVAPDVERFPARSTPIAEFEKKLAAMNNPRDRAMLLLLATTEIRQKELVALTLDAVELSVEATIGDTNAGSIVVTRSSGRQHFTIDYRCWLALKMWLVVREKVVEEKATTERSVFLNRFGRKITPRGIRYLFLL